MRTAAALAAVLALLAVSAAAETSLPYRGEFLDEIRETFFEGDLTLAPAKVRAYRAYVERKLLFLRGHIERHDMLDEGESRKDAREEAEEADITVALERTLELLDLLQAARTPARAVDLAAEILMLDYGTRGFTDPLASLKIPVHLYNMTMEWSIPSHTSARRVHREAGNLVDPETGRFLSDDELRALVKAGSDLSELDPPPETHFWRAKPDISRVDVTANYFEGGHPVYEGLEHQLPPYDGAVFEYRKAHKTQSKPKIDVFYLSPECRAKKKKKARRKCREKIKLKFGMETHADPVGNALLAALGYNSDVSMHIKRPRMYLGDATYEDLAADWIGYFDRQRVHTYIPLETVVIERGHDERGEYVVFSEANAEVKPRELVRIGFFAWSEGMASESREARGLGIFNAWIANADMKDEENNKVSLREDADGTMQMYLTQQDIGHAMGYVLPERPDAFPWDLVEQSVFERTTGRMRGKIELNYVNLQQAGLEWVPTYADAKWMTRRIAQLTRAQIEEAVGLGHWPGGIGPLYVEKLINRRNQLVRVFDLEDEFPLLPVDRYITTADGSVVDGELVQTRWDDSSIEYGHHWRDTFGPAAVHVWNMLKEAAQVGVGAVDAIIPPEVEISGAFAFHPDILIKVSRQVHLNPEPEGHWDQWLVEDTMTLGFRPRFGFVGHVEAALYTTMVLVYPEATRGDAVNGRNRVLPLLLPIEVRRDKLPERYVLFREQGYKSGGRLRTDDAALLNPFAIDANAGWVVAERSVLDRRRETPLLWLDDPRYLETGLRGFFKAWVLEIPILTDRQTAGSLAGSLFELDPARLDTPGSRERPVIDDVVRRDDVRDVASIQQGPALPLRSSFHSRDGRANFFFALWRSRAREDRLEIGEDARDAFRAERRSHFSWTLLDNGEIFERSARGFLGDDAGAVVVDFSIDDKNTHSDEFDRYYAFLNGLGAGRGLLAPGFVASDWEVSSEPDGGWTRLLGYGSLHLHPRAIERLTGIDERRFWTRLAAHAGVPTAALDDYRAKRNASRPKQRLAARGSRLGWLLRHKVDHAERALRALRGARDADSAEERMRLVVKALGAASYRSEGAFETHVLAALLEAIELDALLDDGDVVIGGRLTRTFEDELNIPERRDMVGRLGGKPYAETRYPLFPFDGPELYRMLDWAREKPKPASPAFDPGPPVR